MILYYNICFPNIFHPRCFSWETKDWKWKSFGDTSASAEALDDDADGIVAYQDFEKAGGSWSEKTVATLGFPVICSK